MFFELEQINRQQKSIEYLQKDKLKLNDLVNDAYQPQPKVKNSLKTIIADIIKIGNNNSQLFTKIQDDAMQGYLIPSFIDFERFTSDRGEMPEWTKVVFDKEFEKQKKSLDVMAKKIYTVHFLTEAKDNHSRQLNSFKILGDRYRVLSEHDQTIDIMSEAEKMKNFSKLTKEKFSNYLNLISSKVVNFIEQMSSKCLNFGNELNNMGAKSANNWVYPESYPRQQSNQNLVKTGYQYAKPQGETWLTRANRTFDRNSFKSTKSPQDYVMRQPKWLSTFSSDYYV